MWQMSTRVGFSPQVNGYASGIQLNSFVTPLVINVTGPQRGIFGQAGIHIVSANIGTLVGALDVTFEYAFDGDTSPTKSVPLFEYSSGVNRFSSQAHASAIDRKGDGTAAGDYLILPLQLPFRYAALLRVNCNSAPDSGVPRLANFSGQCALGWDPS